MVSRDRSAEDGATGRRAIPPDRWSRLQALFEEGVVLDSKARSAFFARCRATDADLAYEVEALVRAGDDAGSFIERTIARALTRS
ncbi:MAG TPA: hypothetical protein VMM18_17660 [Gemmatimonadaceae bacterium]|nr:hypothetical protein [Gemmatimonadaceae bacterium]